MVTFLLTLVVLGLVIAGMSIGVILANKPIKGSCGGMGALGIDTACDICGGDTSKCEEETRSTGVDKSEALSYDATKDKQ